MNLSTLFKIFDTVMAVRNAGKGNQRDAAADAGLPQTSSPGIAGQLDARLTNVVVAALKEAFDRDHARLELERTQLEEQRRRAEEAVRMELQRQAIDREVGRLRLLAGTALAGWIASIALLVLRLSDASVLSRGVLVAGWLLLLGSLSSAFLAQARIGAYGRGGDSPPTASPAGSAALALLVTGLALSGLSLLV